MPKKNPRGGGRIYPDDVTKRAKKAVQDALGHGEWVDRYKRPFVYFSPKLPADQKKAAIDAVQKALTIPKAQPAFWGQADETDFLKENAARFASDVKAT